MRVNQGIAKAIQRYHLVRWVIAVVMGITILMVTADRGSASEDVPAPLAEVVHGALDGWAEFAAIGDLAAVSSTFHPKGPQWRQFERESAASWTDRPGEPLRMDVLELRVRRIDSTAAIVWGKVEVSRAGFVSEVASWDFDLVREDDEWQVWTVVAADAPPYGALSTGTTSSTRQAPATTLSQLDTAAAESPIDNTHPTLPEALDVSTTSSPEGVRLPALSAWIVVVTLIGVAVAGYMAPRIDRRAER